MPNINSSLLALRRKRLGYEQKQIALLLGHKTTYQLCRYETGQRTPGLKEAMKLSILYSLPVQTLFEIYFCRCREELEKTLKQSGLMNKIDLKNALDTAFCSYLELMNKDQISEESANNIRHHIKVLVEERTEKILNK